MSGIDNIDTRGTATAWTDRELLAYIVSAIEHSNAAISFSTAPAPVGRKKSACVVKINKLKKELKADMDLLAAGQPMSCVTVGSHQGKPVRKRKAEDGEGETPKKRGRGKKAVESDREVKQEATPESEGLGEDGAEAEL
ncbi:hypothetical protein C7974DRAFT_407453 [Boeremia exigua]|uniref:uncharacterized protein n=1 Tax=Boeremia exigua TaxID=749465 RepID=UPI001E8EEA27|nr:uncharacterized protein C7974DRAFT_407453 [Boeremia exigua]KAH6643738.1 hypothetical protein C7974DRAFT_407453 [Boeremia exigua]